MDRPVSGVFPVVVSFRIRSGEEGLRGVAAGLMMSVGDSTSWDALNGIRLIFGDETDGG